MTRKQATIAVRSGLNDDEQYGCVVPPIHLSVPIISPDLMNLARMTTRVAAILRATSPSARWRNWKAAQGRY